MSSQKKKDAKEKTAYKKYLDTVEPGKLKEALEHAVRRRDFEIELYYKRGTYSWAFVAVAFAGYFAISKDGCDHNPMASFVISCLGTMFTWAWLWVGRASAYWHIRYEEQIKALRCRVFGPYYEPKLEMGPFWSLKPYRASITKINTILSLYVFLVWVVLVLRSIPDWRNLTIGGWCTYGVVGGGCVSAVVWITWKCTGERKDKDLKLEPDLPLDGPTGEKPCGSTGRMVIVAAAVAVVLILMFLLSVKIPPRNMTISAMGETIVRMRMYMQEHRAYPTSLDVLPKRQGYANRVTDGWNRKLIYRVDEDGVISLTSLGRDGKQGGEGEDRDISKRRKTRNRDGTWMIDDESWLIDSEMREEDPLNNRMGIDEK